jgi:hypothetical protein
LLLLWGFIQVVLDKPNYTFSTFSHLFQAEQTYLGWFTQILIINSILVLGAFIDPHLSAMTDDVSLGKCSETKFRKYIVYMTIARLLGTLLAQILFLPSAKILSWTAKHI